MIGHLAGASRGAGGGTLGQLCTGCVGSVMDDCLSMQVAANGTCQSSLDTVRGQALRLVGGDVGAALTAACEEDSAIGPLELRRGGAALEAVGGCGGGVGWRTAIQVNY